MNNRTEKTVITIETFRRTTVHLRRENCGWCGHCGTETSMIHPEEAAVHLHCTVREVFRLAKTGGVHFAKPVRGVLLVCRNSFAV